MRTIRIALAAAALCVASMAASAQETKPGGAFDESQTQAIREIIRDYLVKNPEILIEMQAAFEKKAESARAEAMQKRLPEFYKTLAEMKDELAPFTVGEGDITIVEFFDYNCGYCRRALPDILALMEKDKNVRTIFIEYPILSNDSLSVARVAVAAARQGKYFEVHRALMTGGPAKEETALKAAEKLGLDMAKLRADMQSPDTAHLLAKLAQMGRELFIDGTPSFLIGDELYPGAAEAEQLQEMVRKVRESGCKACVKEDRKS
jgi:protein-disulfide isomerase